MGPHILIGAFSGIEEVKKAVPYLVDSINLLIPHIDALKLVSWPIVVGILQLYIRLRSGGSLATETTHRQVLKEACIRMDGIGDFRQILAIMEKAWEQRDAKQSVETHWRDIMQRNGWCLLFS